MPLFAWILGSLSPLEVLRGMLDMSLRWWRVSPLIAFTRLLLILLLVWGFVELLDAPGRALALIAAGVLGLFVLRSYQHS